MGLVALGTVGLCSYVQTQAVLQPAPAPKGVFVRGYIATTVGGRVDVPGVPPPARDVFLPGINVFLRNDQTGEESKPAITDLSGRFTLRAPSEGRYRVCWKAPGFVDDCSKEIFSVSSAPVHVSTVHIMPDRGDRTTVVFGKVRMKDGSSPRTLEPLANVNAFARVALLDGGDNLIQEVFVNNFGDYLLPKVPVKAPIVLRTQIEGATRDQRILPEANLDQAPFHAIDLVVGNAPPRLEPIVPTTAMGKRVKTATPGDKVRLDARAFDADGDPLKFSWLVADGSGTLNATDTPGVTWTLPNLAGLYSVTLLAYDGKGGYTRSSLSLRTDNLGIPFSGQVVTNNGLAVAGAQVEVNGQLAITDAQGFFQLRVMDAVRFVLNIRKPGFALVSRIYDDSVVGGRWPMARASVTSIDPTRDNEVVNQRDPRDCPGPASARLNWRDYPQLAQPQWQDGKGNVVAPFGKLEVPLPQVNPDERPKECGPGIRVRIPANALVDERGQPPTGNVDVALSTVDLMSPEQMPGDYTVKSAGGGTQVMQSYGAGIVEITGAGRRYNLKSGATAQVEIPVDPSQLAAGGPLPPTIPLLFYDERAGVWIPEGDATLAGTVYVATVKHFTPFNTDTLKVNQSCVRVLSPTLPSTYNLEVTIPMGPGAAPKVITNLINNAPPSEHVIYNLPSNVNIVLVPIRLTDNTPIGTFVVNTGGHQNPTTPNLPSGPPYVACSTQVTLTELAVPDEPLSGEFLHGLFSFEATNLNELNPADPTQAALKKALDDSTKSYYQQIDPRGKRLNLGDFKKTNGFGGPGELHAIYANSGDLGFGRDMYCVRNGADVAAYVTNYGNILTSDTQDAIDAANGAAVGGDPTKGATPVATVAMEYSRIESPPGNPVEFDDPERVVKFYVYNADGSQLLRSADLDSGLNLRPRPIPQLCMVCHNGKYPGGVVTGAAPPFNSRDDVKLNSRFLPFDLHFYTFPLAPNDKANQQAVFKSMNENIVKNTPPDPAIENLITRWYAGGPTQDENVVVSGWDTQPSHHAMYQNVVSRACRTCHVANVFQAIKFDQASQVIDILGSVETRVCVQHVMPHAKVTHRIFWTSVGPHMPAQLQAFGDTFGAGGAHGWSGTHCGQFTPGGTTPVSFYASTIQPIFEGVTGHCTSCHIGNTPPKNLNLTAANSYSNLFNVNSIEQPTIKRIGPFDAANSYLFLKINGTQPSTVPENRRMPLDGPPFLNAGDTTTIQSWINSGAPGP
jgi:hypothetical protein